MRRVEGKKEQRRASGRQQANSPAMALVCPARASSGFLLRAMRLVNMHCSHSTMLTAVSLLHRQPSAPLQFCGGANRGSIDSEYGTMAIGLSISRKYHEGTSSTHGDRGLGEGAIADTLQWIQGV